MVVTDPRTNERRRRKEAAIRVIDLIVYLFAMAGGVFALFVPPDTIRRSLEGFEWLSIGWGVLLLVAGTLGLVGRLTPVWIIEVHDLRCHVGVAAPLHRTANLHHRSGNRNLHRPVGTSNPATHR
jgi:hypothetical protein